MNEFLVHRQLTLVLRNDEIDALRRLLGMVEDRVKRDADAWNQQGLEDYDLWQRLRDEMTKADA